MLQLCYQFAQCKKCVLEQLIGFVRRVSTLGYIQQNRCKMHLEFCEAQSEDRKQIPVKEYEDLFAVLLCRPGTVGG